MASAPSFTTDRIRNVCVVGHGGSGKTTLVDACCFTSGSSRRQGSVDDGTALTMFTPEETSHGISMNVSVAHAAWMDSKINFIDTPGYLDFLGETKAGIRVADGALVCVSAPAGVEVGTDRVWELVQERHLPAVFFVTSRAGGRSAAGACSAGFGVPAAGGGVGIGACATWEAPGVPASVT